MKEPNDPRIVCKVCPNKGPDSGVATRGGKRGTIDSDIPNLVDHAQWRMAMQLARCCGGADSIEQICR